MVKTESPVLTHSCRELLARVFLALVEEAEDRGTVVAQGGGKVLSRLPCAPSLTSVAPAPGTVNVWPLNGALGSVRVAYRETSER
ncbi:Protein unc-45 like protein A [Pteropus alecto]|uniref:Protein unc-45 like protein A n=1 Tax=Pteropus alecto TaxID=9402 RepID=L5KCP4_PTEAL|nr:Protein unc-45 like protein A [Pteropus alecto]